jgi:hypothetical protein
VSEVYEAMALVAERVHDWQQGGPRPAADDEALDDAMERMSTWLDEAPTGVQSAHGQRGVA